jgi:hypothetical protein
MSLLQLQVEPSRAGERGSSSTDTAEMGRDHPPSL